MDVRNCKMCGRLFNVLNNERICPACQKKLEDKFHEVKEYLEEHPGASVEQTATDNDISTKQIRQWVREERLILSTATEAGIVCEKCGKPIRTGRFCERCKERMANEFQNAYQKPEPKMEDLRSTRGRDRMRYLKMNSGQITRPRIFPGLFSWKRAIGKQTLKKELSMV